MTPEEWPIWTPPERGAYSPALRAGRDRLPTVRQDFFLDSDYRLTEQERALMTAMLHRLVADIAAEMQTALPEDWLPANEDNEGLIERIATARLLDIEDVIALFLRRADEERVTTGAQSRSSQSARSLVQPFVSDEEPDVAAAAMTLLIARGRRRDRYGRAIVELDDVAPSSARLLVFAVAAGLRERLPVHISARAAEQQLAAAAASLLRKHDPSRSLDRQVARFVEALANAQRLDDAFLTRAIELADLPVLAHALAQRATIAPHSAFDELMSCEGRRAMMILRMANTERSVARTLLAALGDLIGLEPEAHHLDTFDHVTAEQLESARAWLQLDPALQIALRSLGHGNGHRPL